MGKTDLRLEAKTRLNLIGEDDYRSYSQKISQNLLDVIPDFISKQKKTNVGVFSPIQKEPLWFESFNDLEYSFSCVHMNEDSSLEFYELDLETIKLGVDISMPIDLRKVEVCPDIILIPGLAFTKDLYRLCRGMGCYDKFLKNFKGLKIGVFFDVQKFDELQIDEHDEKLDMIITESKIYK